METVTRAQRHPSRAGEPPPPSTARRLVNAAAGPALIVVSVLIALRGIAFLPNLSDQHPDVLSFWLPRSCMLGRAIADGHVPLWNPFEMSGTWFAADPQSGWLSLPTMATSWLFGCGGGLRALIVLNPILAGLGLFWFLRKEGLGRIAATAGGLSLSMAVSASILAISLPFAGTLAWTPLILVGASRFFARAGWRRLGWLALAAFAWGQVATSHLSHGLVMATGLVVAYVVARAIREARRGTLRPGAAVGWSVAFLLFLPLANLAILVPHFAVLARSSLADGYGSFGGTVARVSGGEEAIPIPDDRHLGGVAARARLDARRVRGGRRPAVRAVRAPRRGAAVPRRRPGRGGGVAYLLTNTVLVGAGWFRSFVLVAAVRRRLPAQPEPAPLPRVPHRPGPRRGRDPVVPGPAAVVRGGDALDRRGARRVPRLPADHGRAAGRLTVFAVASAAVVGVVWAFARGRRWAPVALCAVLGAELLVGAIWSSVYQGGTVYLGLETGNHAALVAAPLRWPDVDVHEYLSPGPIARALQRSGVSDGRYLAWIRPDAYFNKGYLFTRKESDWPALLIGRSVLFEVPDALGYSPVQLPGYWAYIHATNRLPVFYNAAVIQVPTLADLRLLGARYLIVPQGIPSPLPRGVSGRTIETEGAYRLVEIDGAQPRASVVPSWRWSSDETSALDAVLAPGFDPAEVAVLASEPGPIQSVAGPAGSATYQEVSPEDVRIRAEAAVPSILVVRNAWDDGWSATLDGRAVPVLRADAFLQGIAIPAGSHDVRLTYREPAIGRGLALSAFVWLGFLVALAVVVLRARGGLSAGVGAGRHAGAPAADRARPRKPSRRTSP